MPLSFLDVRECDLGTLLTGIHGSMNLNRRSVLGTERHGDVVIAGTGLGSD